MYHRRLVYIAASSILVSSWSTKRLTNAVDVGITALIFVSRVRDKHEL